MCQSTMPVAEYRALQERVKGEYPAECPRCRSDSAFCPTFDVDGEMFYCSACGHMWSPDE